MSMGWGSNLFSNAPGAAVPPDALPNIPGASSSGATKSSYDPNTYRGSPVAMPGGPVPSYMESGSGTVWPMGAIVYSRQLNQSPPRPVRPGEEYKCVMVSRDPDAWDCAFIRASGSYGTGTPTGTTSWSAMQPPQQPSGYAGQPSINISVGGGESKPSGPGWSDLLSILNFMQPKEQPQQPVVVVPGGGEYAPTFQYVPGGGGGGGTPVAPEQLFAQDESQYVRAAQEPEKKKTPWWVWAALAGGAYMMMKGKKGKK